MANSVDPDEKACYKSSHLDLHCFQRYLYRSVGMKELHVTSHSSRSDGVHRHTIIFLFLLKSWRPPMDTHKICFFLLRNKKTLYFRAMIYQFVLTKIF